MVDNAEEQTKDSGVPPGESFQYNFNCGEQIGTYWIHSHVKGQYPNGLRAPFIIRDPDTPYKYDDQIVLSVSDWVCLWIHHVNAVQSNDANSYPRVSICR